MVHDYPFDTARQPIHNPLEHRRGHLDAVWEPSHPYESCSGVDSQEIRSCLIYRDLSISLLQIDFGEILAACKLIQDNIRGEGLVRISCNYRVYRGFVIRAEA